MTGVAERLRARLQEYDDTLATPGQAQDIAEADLLHDVREMVSGETGMGLTPEELDDLAWALLEAFPEVNVNPVHSPDFWPGKATALLPVINKIRDNARKQGREITLDEALEKK